MERCHNSVQDFLERAVLTGVNQKQRPENCLKIERSGRTRSVKCKKTGKSSTPVPHVEFEKLVPIHE